VCIWFNVPLDTIIGLFGDESYQSIERNKTYIHPKHKNRKKLP